MAADTQGIDANLTHLLEKGVPTGFHTPIAASVVWKKEKKENVHSQLDICGGNWQSAEEDPDEALRLVLEEVDAGFVKELPGDLDQAKATWDHNALGKLGVRTVPGKKSRLVLGSTAPGLNQGVTIHERALYPTIGDVQDFYRSDCHA